MNVYIDPDIVKYLDEMYPDKAPDLSMDQKAVWFYAGQISVIRHLKEQLKLQEESKYELA